MTKITTPEFRANQTKYLDLARCGEPIIILRRNEVFKLTQVTDDELMYTRELEARIAQSRRDLADGKLRKVSTKEELKDLLDSL